jgi:hypothetical protein
MEYIAWLISFILHIDRHLVDIMQQYGTLTYFIMFLIIFCETGLVVAPLLPGDSLIFALGALAAGGELDIALISGVLAVAKAFATMAENPQRSVIFIAFAGEEKGLLGSSTYVHRPLWPLNKTVAMINLDMIARNDPDSVQILGARQNPGLAKVVRKENKEIGFKLAVSKSKYLEGGSDHVPFFKSGVPVIFFFTGLHEDYHQVTDNPDRINADKAARVSRLAFLTAWAVANESRHYKIVHPAGRENE